MMTYGTYSIRDDDLPTYLTTYLPTYLPTVQYLLGSPRPSHRLDSFYSRISYVIVMTSQHLPTRHVR